MYSQLVEQYGLYSTFVDSEDWNRSVAAIREVSPAAADAISQYGIGEKVTDGGEYDFESGQLLEAMPESIQRSPAIEEAYDAICDLASAYAQFVRGFNATKTQVDLDELVRKANAQIAEAYAQQENYLQLELDLYLDSPDREYEDVQSSISDRYERIYKHHSPDDLNDCVDIYKSRQDDGEFVGVYAGPMGPISFRIKEAGEE